MTEPTPGWASNVPSTEGIHKTPAKRGGELTFPFTPQQLMEIGAELIEQFLRRVVNAVAGVFIPGVDAFTQLQNWGNDIGEFVGNIFDTIVDALNDLLGGLFGGVNFGDLPTPGEFWSSAVSMFNPGTIGQNLVSGLTGALNALDDWITDIIIGIGNALDDIPIVGRDLEAALLRLFNVRQKAVTADTRSVQIVEDVQAGWSNSVPAGTPTPVFDTITAIRESFINGYTVLTYTSNDSWTVPAGLTELWYIVIGGGGKGSNGGQLNVPDALAAGGAGGSSGGYRAEQIDPSTLTAGSTVGVTVGAAAATAGTDGGTTTIDAVSSVKNSGAIASPFGYTLSASMPGRGGRGGDAQNGSSAANIAESGESGESSALAAGGTAGVGGTGSGGNAGHGANASVSAPTKSGGGGGGGGGGRRSTSFGVTVNGGDGGNGGYPGGGSGGGGGAVTNNTSTPVRGTSGTPGNGIAFIMYKAAA